MVIFILAKRMKSQYVGKKCLNSYRVNIVWKYLD